MDERQLRMGVLGAARIAPAAVVRPARKVAGIAVTAVAARDPQRAAAFAKKHGIANVHPSYDALLSDPAIDVVYNPLPNGLHARWTIAALEAGKDVLCEKPFTANAAEAREVAAVAARTGRTVMEAFHYRYHPLAHAMKEVVTSGEIGKVRHVETAFCFPLPRFRDIRWQYDLAGGAAMDAGCYAVHMARTLGGGEPEVVSARAKLRSPNVDRFLQGELRFPSGATGRITCSMWSSDVLRLIARVVGDAGELRVLNPLAPQFFHRFSVRGTATRRQRFPRRPTYEYQLEAFVGAVTRGEPILTGTDDAIANMTAIDALYTAAGLPPRGTS